MNHLSPAEFVDAADRALPPPRAAHLEGCPRCREQVEAVRGALAAAQSVDVPEPSPLYWRHLSAHVRQRVAGETIAPAWRARSWREMLTVRALVPLASALAIVVAVIATGELSRPRVPAAPPAPASAVATLTAEGIEPEDSDVWQVLTSAAADMPIEDAHAAGMGVPAGAIDRAVQRMTPAELNELGRLLQSQMRGSGD